MDKLKERYASALFEMSIESGMLSEHMKQAAYIRDTIISSHAESFLSQPSISDSEKREFLQSLFESEISGEFMGFLRLAAEKSHEGLILPTIEAYIDMGNRRVEKISATVMSASELSKEQIHALGELLSKKLGKQVEIITRIDPAVIGGLYIYVDGRLIDRTVRTQLKNMKKAVMKRGIE